MGTAAPKPQKRDVALAFIVERIARDGLAPSLREIARELAVSVPRARELVDQLIECGQVARTAGAVRGLRVVNVAQSRLVLTDVLRRLGFHDAIEGPLARAVPLPHDKLPLLPEFEHLPDVDMNGSPE